LKILCKTIKASIALYPILKRDRAFYTWLYRIGINPQRIIWSRWVSVAQVTKFENEDGEFEETHQVAEADNPETTLLTKEIGITVNAAIESLPEELKVTITLREDEAF
jgi:RNA polymerase sigma-70 factor (ECF subfamily)